MPIATTQEQQAQAVASLAAGVLGGADPWKELARAGLLDASELHHWAGSQTGPVWFGWSAAFAGS